MAIEDGQRGNTDDGELALALHSVSEFGQWIRGADSKAVWLFAVHGLMITVYLDNLSRIAGMSALGWWAWGVTGLAMLFSLGFLAAAQLPRLGGTLDNPLAFPSAARNRSRPEPAGDVRVRTHLAWDHATTLARIALRKYCWLKRATFSSMIAVAAFVAWLAALAPSGG